MHLANLSFADLYGLDLDVWVDQDVAAIGPDIPVRGDYFPERTLARWLVTQDLPPTVYAFPSIGVGPLLERTSLMRQVSSVIEEFRTTLPRQRPPRTFPH
ncbi:hypothetical protein OG234_33790 [Streptomyces sp. NBC_01420]